MNWLRRMDNSMRFVGSRLRVPHARSRRRLGRRLIRERRHVERGWRTQRGERWQRRECGSLRVRPERDDCDGHHRGCEDRHPPHTPRRRRLVDGREDASPKARRRIRVGHPARDAGNQIVREFGSHCISTFVSSRGAPPPRARHASLAHRLARSRCHFILNFKILRASATRHFTVPSGIPSIAAISS